MENAQGDIQEEEEPERENNQDIRGDIQEGIQEKEEQVRENDQDITEEIVMEGIQGEEELERENAQEGENNHEDTSDQEQNVQENDQNMKSKDNPAPKGKQKRRRAGELLVDNLSTYYQLLAKRRLNKKN